MVTVTDLWLPIVLSGAAVFFLSFVMWMVLPHHRKDFTQLPEEEHLLADLRKHGLQPGQYTFPFCMDPKEMQSEAFQKKLALGPGGWMIVRPSGPVHMGGSMAKSFVYNVVVSALVAYVASVALAVGAEDVAVLRITITTAWLGYSGALMWDYLWMHRSGGSTLRSMLDGIVYAVATGALFMAFWPDAV